MCRRNRVTPFGEIIAVPERGTFMGNRGILHYDRGNIRRSWKEKRWIICLLKFKGRRRPVMAPGHGPRQPITRRTAEHGWLATPVRREPGRPARWRVGQPVGAYRAGLLALERSPAPLVSGRLRRPPPSSAGGTGRGADSQIDGRGDPGRLYPGGPSICQRSVRCAWRHSISTTSPEGFNSTSRTLPFFVLPRTS